MQMSVENYDNLEEMVSSINTLLDEDIDEGFLNHKERETIKQTQDIFMNLIRMFQKHSDILNPIKPFLVRLFTFKGLKMFISVDNDLVVESSLGKAYVNLNEVSDVVVLKAKILVALSDYARSDQSTLDFVNFCLGRELTSVDMSKVYETLSSERRPIVRAIEFINDRCIISTLSMKKTCMYQGM